MRTLVLIVDDEVDVTVILDLLFQHWGFDTLTAHDGREAYHLATTMQPDLLLTDFNMPVMDGLQLVNQLASNNDTSSIPVIMMSAVFELISDFPVAGKLKKPFQFDDLKKMICSIPIAPKRRNWPDLLGCKAVTTS